MISLFSNLRVTDFMHGAKELKVGVIPLYKELFLLQGTALSFVSIRERAVMEEVENHLRGVYSEAEKVFRLVK
jgi:hypothetical protein